MARVEGTARRLTVGAIAVAGIFGLALGFVPVAVTEPDESSFMPGLGNAIRSIVVLTLGAFLVPIIPATVIGRFGGDQRSRLYWILVVVVVTAIMLGSSVGYALAFPDDGSSGEGLAQVASFVVTEIVVLTVIAAAGALLGYVLGGRLAPATGPARDDPLVWLAGIVAIIFTALILIVLSIVAPNVFGSS